MSLREFQSMIKDFVLTDAQMKEAAEAYAHGGIQAVVDYLDGKVRRGKLGKAGRERKKRKN